MIPTVRRISLLLVFLCPLVASCQGSGSRGQVPYFFHESFLMRLERMSFNSMGGDVQQVCIIVLTDGRFRLEKSREEMTRNGYHENKVYVGTFTPDEMTALKKLLDEPGFTDIRVQPQNEGGKIMHRADVSWLGDIKRNGNMRNLQQFALLDDDVVKKYDKDLKPVANWLKNVEKRKMPEIKKAETTQCRQIPEESEKVGGN